jgi:Flp pilus assembly protein TadD
MSYSLSQYFFKKGISRFKEGQYQDALGFFLKATKEDKQNHKAWNALGVTYSRLETYADANSCFHAALRLDPDNQAYLDNLKKNRVHMRKNSPPKTDQLPNKPDHPS